MPTLLKSYSDLRLFRKITLLRVLFLLLEIVVIIFVVAYASNGEILGRASTGGRANSAATLITIYWSESPFLFSVTTLWYIMSLTLFVVGFYLVFAKLIERLHGRPLFKRKYPY